MNSLRDMFESVKNYDNGIYFIKGDDEESYLSYKMLYDRALNILTELQCQGISKNQELIFQIDDEEEFISVFWACILGGVIAVPLPLCKKNQDVQRLKNVVAKLNTPSIYVEKEYKESLVQLIQQEAMDQCNFLIDKMIFHKESSEVKKPLLNDGLPEDTVLIQFTSGSTGEPKGVELSNLNILSYTSATYVAVNGPKIRSSLSWMPLTHNFGLIGLHISSLIFGINQYIMATNLFLVNPLLWMIKASEKRISLTAAPNFGYMHFLRAFDKVKDLNLDLSSIDVILNGAEPVNDEICMKFTEILATSGLNKNSIIPAYGMAEGTLGITISEPGKLYEKYHLDRNYLTIGNKVQESVTPNDKNSVTLVEAGTVLDNLTLRICDDFGKKLLKNTVGYIQIKGTGVMKGYYNDLEKTRKVLTEDGWLITGDIGFIRNNKLVITGRAKEIIFINGKNYYPNDFESIIENMEEPLINAVSVVGKFNDQIQTEEILVFVQIKETVENLDTIVVKIKKQINLSMGIDIKAVIFLEEMPRTSSGKIQRFKLLEMFDNKIIKPYIVENDIDLSGIISPKEIEDEIEGVVMEVLYSIINAKYISQNDNLIELGMDSLKAGMMISELNRKLQINLEINSLFKHEHIKEVIDEIRAIDRSKYKRIEKAELKKYYPLSSQQKRLYTLNKIDPNNTSYNIAAGMHLYGEVDIERVTDVFNKIVSRHESLRTCFKLIDGNPVQIIYDNITFNVNYKELSKEKADIYKKNFISPFNLEDCPLIKVTLVKIQNEREYLLLLDLHHIISDGMSMGIIVQEFCSLYEGTELPEVKLQYKDYALWQEEQFSKSCFQRQGEYWENVLSGKLPLLEMPIDYERSNIQSFDGDQIKFNIGTELTKKLKDIALDNKMTLYMVLISAYSILLSKYAMQEDILIGSPISGRSHPDFNGTMGMFVNTFVLRTMPNGEKKFIDFLNETKEKTFEAYENQDYQFEWMLKKINYRKIPGRNPLFDVMFNMQNMYIPEMKLENLLCVPIDMEDETSKFDLSLAVHEKEDDITLSFIYCTKLFERETIESLKLHFINLINSVTGDINIKICDISVLSEEEVREYKLSEKSEEDEIELDFNF